jgi:hypothetical protein
MKCHETQLWLLGTRADDDLAAKVQRHLSSCRACQKVRRRLGRLDEAVQSLPVPAADPSARERLLL